LAKKQPEPVLPPRERAFLVGVELRNEPALLGLEDSLAELELLSETAGLEVVGIATQKLDHPHVDTYIGPGKLEEVQVLVEETLAQIVVFDNELSPRHLREIEEFLGSNVRVIDRTALILDIFAQHANTREGKLQVELAQYEYRLPRLTRAWTHLARQAGGGGGRAGSVGGVGLRGPGETQLEVDRREIRKRISTLKEELEEVRAHRQRYRTQRQRTQIPVVALVGYTNAGKSTLLNKISRSDVYVADQLFATLDPTTRRVCLPGNHIVLFTDTVGFIQKLPTQLVAAFRATLEEISSADLLVHVVDLTHPNSPAQMQAVQQTLDEIDAGKIPTIIALNKIDTLPDPAAAQDALAESVDAYAISARTGEGLNALLTAIETHLYEFYNEVTVKLPYKEGKLISLFYDYGQVKTATHKTDHIILEGQIPGRFLVQFEPFIIRKI
jgi:GTP-binding protein HflX